MTTEEKIQIFNQKWKMFLSNITNSTLKHRRKKAIYLVGFYFTRAQIERHSNIFDCLVCFKDWSISGNFPQSNFRATKIVILKEDLLNYYLNGWNRNEEIKDLDNLYAECIKEKTLLRNLFKKYDNENVDDEDFYSAKNSHFLYNDSGLFEVYQRMQFCKKERARILYEKRCVAILLKYMGLTKIQKK